VAYGKSRVGHYRLVVEIKEGIWKDPNALGITKEVKFGKTRKFWLELGYLYYGDG
jgi:hypothetical protein